MAEKKELRPLGRLEKWYIARHDIRFYNNVGVTAQYVLPAQLLNSSGGIQTIVFTVLQEIVCRHPSLGLSVLNEKAPNPSWKRLESIDLKDVVQIMSTGDLEKIIEEEHSTPFNDMNNLPLWKVLVLEDSHCSAKEISVTVGFFYHHALGDGLSGAAFHTDFLEILRSVAATPPTRALSNSTVVHPPVAPLLPSLEEITPLPITYLAMLSKALQTLNSLLISPSSLLYTGARITPTPAHTRLATLSLPPETVSDLLLLCRQHSTTITALLTVTIARIIARAYPSHSLFAASLAISLRRFTGTSSRNIGVFPSGLVCHFSSTPRSGYLSCDPAMKLDWSTVQACKKEIHAISSMTTNQMPGWLRFVDDYAAFLKSKVGMQREESFEVSNLGLVNPGEEGDGVRCTSLMFSQAANVVGPPYVFSVVTVKGGEMMIGLTWQNGLLHDEEVEKVMDTLKAELLGLPGTERGER